jgi:hypothetical protein
MARRCLVVVLLTALCGTVWAAGPDALPYNLVFSPRPGTVPSTGTVVGQFGGVPVGGRYSGNSFSGTVAYAARDMAFAEGAYTCGASGCAFTGTLAGQRVSMQQSTLSGIGQATSSLFPNRDRWMALVSNWAAGHLSAQDAASVTAAASHVDMQQGSTDLRNGGGVGGETGGGSGTSGAGGGTGGMGGGSGGMGGGSGGMGGAHH